MSVKCPFGDECAADAKKILPKGAVKTAMCKHSVEHEHSAACNNGVCHKVMPKSASCVITEEKLNVIIGLSQTEMVQMVLAEAFGGIDEQAAAAV